MATTVAHSMGTVTVPAHSAKDVAYHPPAKEGYVYVGPVGINPNNLGLRVGVWNTWSVIFQNDTGASITSTPQAFLLYMREFKQ